VASLKRDARAIGAVVARFVHTEEVTGSNPVSPTNTNRLLTSRNTAVRDFCFRLIARYVPDKPSGKAPQHKAVPARGFSANRDLDDL
jgi:hypothetical protein